MADPTAHVRRALQHLTDRTAMRLEVAQLRRQLAETREDLAVHRLLVAMAPYALPARYRITPTAPRLLSAAIPAPRLTPEGVRHARAGRPR